MNLQRCVIPCLAAGVLAFAATAQARITRIVVDKTEASATDAGYETLRGRAFGALDPTAPANKIITDLQHAPRNAQGLVEYTTTFSLSKPVDMARASGVLWYELVNRAGPLRTFDSMAPHGHVTLMNGWQGDIAATASNYTVQVPAARLADGTPITGTVFARLADTAAGTSSRPLAVLANAIPYDAASLATDQARMTRRRAWPAAGQLAQSLPRHEDLPQDFRNLRLDRIQRATDDRRADGHGRQSRSAPARGCAPLLLPRHHARW